MEVASTASSIGSSLGSASSLCNLSLADFCKAIPTSCPRCGTKIALGIDMGSNLTLFSLITLTVFLSAYNTYYFLVNLSAFASLHINEIKVITRHSTPKNNNEGRGDIV
jgi:hypothetical protein